LRFDFGAFVVGEDINDEIGTKRRISDIAFKTTMGESGILSPMMVRERF